MALTVQEETRLMVSEPKEEEITKRWKRLHNEELYILYSSPNIIVVIKGRVTLVRKFQEKKERSSWDTQTCMVA
jgi:hypothetical protein